MVDKKLADELKEARENNKKIGLVQGSWDLFHVGHLKYIQKARKLCDYLIIAMDSDKKIRKRKGNNRPVIPEEERYEFIDLLGIADYIVIKRLDEEKWGLIKTVKPDVLIVIKDNYKDDEIVLLEEICGEVKILPRQAKTSTSDKIRKIMISNQRNIIDDLDKKVEKSIEEFKKRINFDKEMRSPIPKLVDNMKNSTDWKVPVVAACYYNRRWYFGTNQSDFNIPKYDVDNRTELFYASIEHAEINLLKKLGDIEKLEVPVYTSLLPCDKCMKVLHDKGVKKVYYIEDHEHRNWSKRSHQYAKEKGIKLIKLLKDDD